MGDEIVKLTAGHDVELRHDPRRARQKARDLCALVPGAWFEQVVAATGARQVWGDAEQVNYTFTGARVASIGTATYVRSPGTPSPAASLGAVA